MLLLHQIFCLAYNGGSLSTTCTRNNEAIILEFHDRVALLWVEWIFAENMIKIVLILLQLIFYEFLVVLFSYFFNIDEK